MRSFWAGLLSAAVLGQGCAPGPREATSPARFAGDPVDEVIAAERAFSRAAGELGTRAAFVRYFAEDAVSFGPEPRVGRRVVAEGPELPPLEWWPAVAEASAAGDMGYTSGPYRATRPDGSAAWGHYHSVWGRAPDGSWRVLIDIGGPHGPAAVPASVAIPERVPATLPAAAADPVTADRRCLEIYAAQGRDPALDACAWPDARIYRFGAVPFTGRAAALADQREAGESLSWSPDGGKVATSGDVGFTWGTGTISRDETGGEARPMSYARFWRRDGDGAWRYVVEVILPYPPARE